MRYYHFENVTRQQRRRKRLKLFAVALALLFTVTFLFVLRDLLRKQEVKTLDSGVTRKITKLDDFIIFDEKDFTIKLPSGWQHSKTTSSDIYSYKSGQKTHEALSLDIYMNNAIPADFSTTRALPIEITDGKIVSGLLSEHCSEFTKPKEGFGESVVSPSQQSIWQGIGFMCNFSNVLNYASTINKPSGFATKIAGPKTSNLYLFSYTDHTSRPDFLVFDTILSTFTPK